MQTHYDILGIQPTADLDTIKHAWHIKAMLLHPDRHEGASAEVRAEAAKETLLINAAWDTLKDPAKRGTYDLQLSQSNGASRVSGPTTSNARMVQIVCTSCGHGQAVLPTANRFNCAKCKVAFRFCTCASCKAVVHVREAFEAWICPTCKHEQPSYWVTTTTLACVRCSTKFVFAKGVRAVRCSGCNVRYDRCPHCETYNTFRIDFGARKLKCTRCRKAFVR